MFSLLLSSFLLYSVISMMMNAKRQKLLQKLEEDKRRADELFEKKYPIPVELQRTLDVDIAPPSLPHCPEHKISVQDRLDYIPFRNNNIPLRNAPNQSQGQFHEATKDSLSVRKKQAVEKDAAANKIDNGKNVLNDSNTPPYMRHRLRNRLEFFKTFVQSTLVLSWISNGFDLRWNDKGIPPSKQFPNHASVYQHHDIVTNTINEFLNSGAIQMVDHRPHIVSPLGIVFQKDKSRLIFDGRYVNSFLQIPAFKYEDLGCCYQYLKPNDYMLTYDLSKGYHHIDIAEEFVTYLGFQWQDQYYVFTSLPFGLAPACWAFTKLTRELLNKWRRRGIRCSSYIDDFITAHLQYWHLLELSRSVFIPDFLNCGFVLNDIKSLSKPVQKAKHLGFFIDSVRGCFDIPKNKRDSVIGLLKKVIESSKHCSYHTLEQLAGNLASMHWAFGRLSRLMTMSIYTDLSKYNHLSYLPLSDSTVEDLRFWLVGFDAWTGFRPIWQPVGFHMTIYTDAAGFNLCNYGGWAGWSKTPYGDLKVARGNWSKLESDESSTFQELLAIFNVTKSFNQHSELRGKRILIHTDNQAVFFIINKAGSRTATIHDLCKQFLWYCITSAIDVHANWIPREQNELADFYSKEVDSSDWKLRPDVFALLTDRFGTFDIDLFASYNNYQVKDYYSLYYTPTCSGIDAFNFHWGRACWCNPPFFQMARVLAHAFACSARMCLICPFTPTAPWWHSLLDSDPLFFASFVHNCVDLLDLCDPIDLFLSGRYDYAKGASRKPRWRSLALLVDFATPTLKPLRIPYSCTVDS